MVPRGGPWAGEKGRVNLAPHPRRGLSGLLAHLAPRRRLQAVPVSARSVHAAEFRDAGRAPRSPAPPARGHPFPEPHRAFPCLQTQPARLSTAFLACPASLLPARAPPALCTGRGRAEMRFPSLAPLCPALPLPTLRRSWLPAQHSPLSHRWVFVSVCLLSLCPAGLLSCSLLDSTTASPQGREGNRCSVKRLLGD